jgi:hypothetical protein
MPSPISAIFRLVPPIHRLQASRNALMAERDALLAEREALSAQLAAARHDRDTCNRDLAVAQTEWLAVARERDAARTEGAALTQNLAAARAEGMALAQDLAAARLDGARVIGELAAARQDCDRLTGALLLAQSERDAARQEAARQAELTQWNDRLRALEALTENLNARSMRESHRVDYVLAHQEGILAGIDDFHAARATAAYRAAFSDPDPLVSITVITAHRPDLLVSRCLHSLQAQTYRNLQIIVVGDHCTDDTPARVAALRDDRISFHNLPARGPYPPPGPDRWRVAGTHPANKALSLCEGQFICHLDDDDRFEPERIAIMVAAAQANEADFCWHPFQWENADGTWRIIGDGTFELGQIGTSSVFYHRYFARIPDDVHAYRIGEPGDWNRLRKIKLLRPKTHFVEQPLVYHYSGSEREAFVAQPGETFLE